MEERGKRGYGAPPITEVCPCHCQNLFQIQQFYAFSLRIWNRWVSTCIIYWTIFVISILLAGVRRRRGPCGMSVVFLTCLRTEWRAACVQNLISVRLRPGLTWPRYRSPVKERHFLVWIWNCLALDIGCHSSKNASLVVSLIVRLKWNLKLLS